MNKGDIMVVLKFYGLDQYVVGNYSKEHTSNIAKILETGEEEIMFYAPNSYIFHNGVEQTSWNTVIEILLEEKYHDLEAELTQYLIKTLALFSINLHIIFTFYNPHHAVSHFNDKYPHFIRDDNLVKIKEEDTSDVDILDEEQVFTGDIFKDFKKKK